MATLPSCSKAPKILVPKVRYWKVGGDGGNLLWNSWKCWNRRLEKCWNVGMEECWNGVMEECWND